MHQWYVKFLFRNFYPFWPPYGRKLRFGTFDRGATRWVKFDNFHPERIVCCRTLHQWCVKFLSRIFYPFWPPYGRKFRLGTFDPKKGKSWIETLRTSGKKFRSGTLHSAECLPGTSDQIGKIQKFSPGESIFLRNFAPVVRKVSLQDFLPVLATLRSKIPTRYFRPQKGKNRGKKLHAPWVQSPGVALDTLQSATPVRRTREVKFEHFYLERIFCFRTWHQWCVKFLSRIFYPFWPPYIRKFRFGTFDWFATKNGVQCFRPWCEFPYLRTLTSDATNGGLMIIDNVESNRLKIDNCSKVNVICRFCT